MTYRTLSYIHYNKNIYNKSHQKNNISIRNKKNTYTIGCLRE